MARKTTSGRTPRRTTAPAHLTARVSDVRRRLRDTKADALLVTNPRDIRYLTGFVGDDSWALISQHSATVHVFSDFRFDEQIRREAPHVRAIMRKQSLADELAKVCDRQRRIERVGLQPAYVNFAERKTLAKKLGASKLVELDDGLLAQRAIKSADELKAIRKAIKIQQQAFERTTAFIEPGRRESEIAAYLEYQMRLLGAASASFPIIVAANANASLPHAVPGSAKATRGGIVLIDWGAQVDGYCSDMTRTVALGSMKPKLREIYQIVLDAQEAAIAAIAPGRPLVEVDAAARDLIRRAGYGKQFGHGLGHGIGLNIHELPSFSPRSTGVLEPGQVVTVEPGIYLPGVGGVRIEDDVLVTERGHKVLSDLPKTLESAII